MITTYKSTLGGGGAELLENQLVRTKSLHNHYNFIGKEGGLL